MPGFTFEICGLPISFSTEADGLLAIYADYFRYYRTVSAPSCSVLQFSLQLFPSLPMPETLRAANTTFLTQSGPISFWRTQEQGREQFYFQTDTTHFCVDPTRGQATGLIAAAALAAPHLLANTYTFVALLLLLRWQRRYHLHTAAVISPHAEVQLICGAQRAGKSTLTTALALSGWQAISDDGILLQADGEGAVEAYAFRRDFHVAAELLETWPELSPELSRHNYFDRACIDGLERFQTNQLAAQPFSHASHVIFPHITGAPKSRLEPMSPSEALHRLIEQSQFFPLWSTHTQEQMRLLTALVKNASCLQLYAGTDIWHDPHCAGELLAR